MQNIMNLLMKPILAAFLLVPIVANANNAINTIYRTSCELNVFPTQGQHMIDTHHFATLKQKGYLPQWSNSSYALENMILTSKYHCYDASLFGRACLLRLHLLDARTGKSIADVNSKPIVAGLGIIDTNQALRQLPACTTR